MTYRSRDIPISGNTLPVSHLRLSHYLSKVKPWSTPHLPPYANPHLQHMTAQNQLKPLAKHTVWMTEEWLFIQKQTSAFPFDSACSSHFPSKSLGGGRHSFTMPWNLTACYFPLQQSVRNRTYTLTLPLNWKPLVWGSDDSFSDACRGMSPQPSHCPSQTSPGRIQHKASLAALILICGPQFLFWNLPPFSRHGRKANEEWKHSSRLRGCFKSTYRLLPLLLKETA